MDEKEIIIIASIAIQVTLVIIVIVLFCVFIRKKNRLLLENKNMEEAIDRKLAAILK